MCTSRAWWFGQQDRWVKEQGLKICAWVWGGVGGKVKATDDACCGAWVKEYAVWARASDGGDDEVKAIVEEMLAHSGQ